MLQGEHSAILLTFIKLPFVIKIFTLSIFQWVCYTGFTVLQDFLSGPSLHSLKRYPQGIGTIHGDKNIVPYFCKFLLIFCWICAIIGDVENLWPCTRLLMLAYIKAWKTKRNHYNISTKWHLCSSTKDDLYFLILKHSFNFLFKVIWGQRTIHFF